MRELRNTKIIAVDHGYGNMKTANTVTPTGIKAYETEPIFTGNILKYNGIYYRIGEGHKEFIPDKAMDEEYYLLTLMAIAREREELFVKQIVGAVENSLKQALPLFLSGLTAGMVQRETQTRASFPTPANSQPDSDVDWDFLGE